MPKLSFVSSCDLKMCNACCVVRVMDCQGSAAVSTVVAGMEWVQKNAVYPAVALMSLGTAASAVLDTAVQSLTSANITVVVAAGNNDLGESFAVWDMSMM